MHPLRPIEPGRRPVKTPAPEVVPHADVAGRRRADRAAGCLCGRSRRLRACERATFGLVESSARHKDERTNDKGSEHHTTIYAYAGEVFRYGLSCAWSFSWSRMNAR